MVPIQIPLSLVLFECLSVDEGIDCVYGQFFSGSDCKEKISKLDRKHAYRRRSALAICAPNSRSAKAILEDYTRHCLCSRHRQWLIEEHQQFWQLQLDFWCGELINMFIEDVDEVFKIMRDFEDGVVLACIKSKITASISLSTDLKLSAVSSIPAKEEDKIERTSHPSELLPLSASSSSSAEWTESIDNVLKIVEERYRNRFDYFSPEKLNETKHSFDSVQAALNGMNVSDFVPYRPGPDSMCVLIERQLSQEESKSGWIYAFRTHSASYPDSQHFKIGYTTGVANKRLGNWSSKCGYKIEEVASIWTANAKTIGLVATNANRSCQSPSWTIRPQSWNEGSSDRDSLMPVVTF